MSYIIVYRMKNGDEFRSKADRTDDLERLSADVARFMEDMPRADYIRTETPGQIAYLTPSEISSIAIEEVE